MKHRAHGENFGGGGGEGRGDLLGCGLAILSLLLLISSPAAMAQDRYPVPWDKVEKETLEHFQALVRIDTTNPPGNETRAAEYVKGVLEREGIPAELLALDPNRANLVARIRGNGSKRPILVMGHTDVVGVQREKWSVDPFAAVRKDGYIWGRGTLDDKDDVTAGLMLMLLLKRQGVKLDRDVIFLCEAGRGRVQPGGAQARHGQALGGDRCRVCPGRGRRRTHQGGKGRVRGRGHNRKISLARSNYWPREEPDTVRSPRRTARS